jgi:hypothetical protein
VAPFSFLNSPNQDYFMEGFFSDCGNYGAFRFGKKFMVVYRGQQLEVFNTINQCKKFIKNHVTSLETATFDPKTTKKPVKIKSSSRRRTKCSQQN